MPAHDRYGDPIGDTPLWNRLLEHPRVDADVSRRHRAARAVWIIDDNRATPGRGYLLDVDEVAQLLGLTPAAA